MKRRRERDAVKIKGIGYHSFNDFTVRMNDGGVRRYEGEVKESDGVKALSDMLAAAAAAAAAVQDSDTRARKPHLSASLSHFSSQKNSSPHLKHF